MSNHYAKQEHLPSKLKYELAVWKIRQILRILNLTFDQRSYQYFVTIVDIYTSYAINVPNMTTLGQNKIFYYMWHWPGTTRSYIHDLNSLLPFKSHRQLLNKNDLPQSSKMNEEERAGSFICVLV